MTHEETQAIIDAGVQKYGEPYRKMITDGVQWLHDYQPVWAIDEPIDWPVYIDELVKKTVAHEG